MKRLRYLYITASAVLVIGFAVVVSAENPTDKRNIEFLNSYGIEVSHNAIERERVNIPNPFDRVWESYNEMQTAAGLDLLPYAGEDAVRHTYEVLNYSGADNVRANVLCVDGEPIGGDVMTTALDGFMKPLNCLTEE